jgi:predicted enzyme involved in methoxymalonyl-ACP biosynthesis
LEQGDRLFTASLADSTGEHGEILAALVTSDNQITHLVMSCRVFQRRVEFAFLAWLMNNGLEPSGFVFRGTDRNRPLQQFLELLGTGPLQDGVVSPDLSSLREQLQEDLSLFVVPPLVGSQ